MLHINIIAHVYIGGIFRATSAHPGIRTPTVTALNRVSLPVGVDRRSARIRNRTCLVSDACFTDKMRSQPQYGRYEENLDARRDLWFHLRSCYPVYGACIMRRVITYIRAYWATPVELPG